MHVSSISQNLRSGRWSTSALRQTWSQTASLQQLQQNRGQLWERCFVIVNITNPPLEDYGSYHFTNFPFFLLQEVLVATHVSRMKKKWVGVPPERQDLLTFSPNNVFLSVNTISSHWVCIFANFSNKSFKSKTSCIRIYLLVDTWRFIRDGPV